MKTKIKAESRKQKIAGRMLLCLVLTILTCLPSRANLTVTVTPGYAFSEGEIPTTDNLNLLGEPTIQVTGTLDGSASLAAGSVNGTLLADSTVDGVTTYFNGSSPRAISVQTTGLIDLHGGIVTSNNYLYLRVDPAYFALSTNSPSGATNGASTNWLTLQAQSLTDTNIAPTARIQGNKIAARAGTLWTGGSYLQDTNDVVNTNLVETWLGPGLAIQPQTNTYAITNGASVTQKTNSGPALVLVTSSFISTNFPLPASSGLVANVPHGLEVSTTTGTLTNSPLMVRWVLVCVTNNCGYVPGDEVDAYAFTSGGVRSLTCGANSTNVFMVKTSSLGRLINKTSFIDDSSVTEADWRAKVYVRTW